MPPVSYRIRFNRTSLPHHPFPSAWRAHLPNPHLLSHSIYIKQFADKQESSSPNPHILLHVSFCYIRELIPQIPKYFSILSISINLPTNRRAHPPIPNILLHSVYIRELIPQNPKMLLPSIYINQFADKYLFNVQYILTKILIVYAGVSFIYGGVKRATAPPAPVEPVKAAPAPAPAKAAPKISAAGLEGDNTIALLNDIHAKVTNIEKLLK